MAEKVYFERCKRDPASSYGEIAGASSGGVWLRLGDYRAHFKTRADALLHLARERQDQARKAEEAAALLRCLDQVYDCQTRGTV